MSRIHHLALRVHDLYALSAFYGTWLNLTVVRDLSPRALWLGLGEGAVLMLEQRAVQEPAIDPRSLELVAFTIDEAGKSALRARLVASRLLEDETDHTLYFRDPEGRRVAVSTYPL